jgi:hypothetical protein
VLTTAALALFVTTLACELGLFHAIFAGLLDDFPLRGALVAGVASLAPAVRNFDAVAPEPLRLQLYLALAICLVVPKAASVLLWLHADPEGAYRQHVVSPLTRTKPGGVGEFILQPVRDLEPRSTRAPDPPRSLVSRIFWSLLILLVTFALQWAFLNTGWEVAARRGSSLEGGVFISGEAGLWLTWSVAYMSFIAVLLAVQICIVRDYGVFFWNLIKPGGSNE